MSSLWRDIQAKYRNSVVQIFATQGSFDFTSPYQSPGFKQSRGSGFLISKDGYIITNAHVVANLLQFTFKSEAAGKKELTGNLIAISPTKDVALLKADAKSIIEIGSFEPLQFGDDQIARQSDPVMAIGYPLGKESIKYTVGVLSGYETPETIDAQSSQSYLQIDLALNAGNSGGPLLNADGKVIGINSAGISSIFAQNTNFAIPSRVVLSILSEMFANTNITNINDAKVVISPSLGLVTHRITPAHFKLVGIEDENDMIGIRVRDIIPGSPFSDIEVGDILRVIEYADPYNHEESFKLETYQNNICLSCNKESDSFIVITRFGNVKLLKGDNLETAVESDFSKNRKLELQEVLDTIPIGTQLTLELLRPRAKEIGITTAHFRNDIKQAIRKLYPPFDKLDYIIFGGIVWIPLSTNVMNVAGDSKNLCHFVEFSSRATARILVAKIFPGTDVQQIDSISPTEVLESVTWQSKTPIDINTLQDLRDALTQSQGNLITFEFKSKIQIVFDLNETNLLDKKLHIKFGISPNEFSRKLWSE